MSDNYWMYSDGRQPTAALPHVVVKRPRTDYYEMLSDHNLPSYFAIEDGREGVLPVIRDTNAINAEMPSGHNMASYYAREKEREGHRVIRDTDLINASYDRYLPSGQLSSYAGGESVRSMSSGFGGHNVEAPCVISMGGPTPAMATKSRTLEVGGGRTEIPLPPDASNTLFVEGLPSNCTRREVCHIFRPFIGYKEARLVNKESRHPAGDSVVLCFVDFVSPAHAAAAMNALQGYKFDENDRDSDYLRVQFARYPGARSGSGRRGRR